MTEIEQASFKVQLKQTLKFFSFNPSMYTNSPRVSNTHKFMLFIIIALIEMFIHLTWYGGILVLSSPIDWFHVAHQVNSVIDRLLIIQLSYVAIVMIVFSVFSLWLITQIPEKSREWLYFQAFYVFIYLVYATYFTIWVGDNSSIEGVMLISATGLGMVLLQWRFVWVSFVICIFFVILFNVSNNMAWWQHLPRLYPNLEARSDPVWGLSFSYLVIAKSSLTLYCILQVLRVITFQRRRIYALLESDTLTNIANRRTIYCFFNYLWLHQQEWTTLSIIYFDLDKFKNINDDYGHDAGDATLVCTAQTLKNFFPLGTMFGRIGGEEFCVVLPNVGIEQAEILAEQLRQEFEKQVVRYGIFDAEIQFTASLGVASVYQNHLGNAKRQIDMTQFFQFMRQDLDTVPVLPPALERIIKFSDLAMQQAKANGRNCVVKGQCYLLMAKNA